MAGPVHGGGTRVYVAQYDWSCALNSGEVQSEREAVDITTFCNTGKRFLFGKGGYSLTMGGFSIFGTPAPAPDAQSFSLFSNNTQAMVGFHTADEVGAIAFEMNARISGRVQQYNIGNAIMLNHTWTADDLARGVVVARAEPAAGAGATVQDVTIPTGDDWRLVCRILGIGGAGSYNAKIEHSVNGTIWADVASALTGALSAVGITTVEGVAVTDLGPYFRINVTAETFPVGTTIVVDFGGKAHS